MFAIRRSKARISKHSANRPLHPAFSPDGGEGRRRGVPRGCHCPHVGTYSATSVRSDLVVGEVGLTGGGKDTSGECSVEGARDHPTVLVRWPGPADLLPAEQCSMPGGLPDGSLNPGRIAYDAHR